MNDERRDIASKILAHLLPVPEIRELIAKDQGQVFKVCQAAISAADVLLCELSKSSDGPDREGWDLLTDLSKADIDLITLANLKERAGKFINR